MLCRFSSGYEMLGKVRTGYARLIYVRPG